MHEVHRVSTPDCMLTSERHSDVFVDDAQNGLNDIVGEAADLPMLQWELQEMSQPWEKL